MAYNDKFFIRSWSLDGKRSMDVSELVQSISWSGSWRDCARQLSLSVLPRAMAELGGSVHMELGGMNRFSGRITDRQRDSLGQTMDVTALDNGLYLKRNSTYLAVRNQTPESVAREVCNEFGVPVGSLASTGVKLSRNFLGSSLYQVIQTMYTLSSEQTGKKYQVRFRGNELDVVEKALGAESLRLVPGSNLLSCQSRDSIQNMVNSVAVYSDEYRRVATYKNQDGYVALYGLMEQAIKASSYESPEKAAREILEENGISTTITADCIGNAKLITGNTVVVHEPVTGTDGLFWIQSDQHNWKSGIYRTKVTLDFRNLMDKQEAGSVPSK